MPNVPPVLPETDKINESHEKLISQFVDTYLTGDATPACYQYLASTPKSMEDKRIVAYKYLMARKWKMEDAAKMFTETSKWREAGGFHTRPLFPSPLVLRGYDTAELSTFFNMKPRPTNEPIDTITRRMYGAYSGSIHKWDKQGHPVTFDLGGQIDAQLAIKTLKELAPPGTHLNEGMVQFRTFENEMLNYLIRFQDAKFSDAKLGGRRVTSVTAVMDAKHLHMGMITSETVDLLKHILAVDQSHYPELLHRMVVVNCSSLVMLLFGLLKPFIDSRVRSKFIFVNPEDTNEVLKSIIDEEHLPQRYGGKCSCEGGCIYTSGQDGTVSHEAKEHEERTVEVHVDAGKSSNRTIAVEKGDMVVLEWETVNGSDVDFEALFKPSESQSLSQDAGSPKIVQLTSPIYEIVNGNTVVAENGRRNRHGFSFTVPCKGSMVVTWGNTFSWLKAKTIRLRLNVIKASSL